MTTRRQRRQAERLAERGRRLASTREDLIAAGANPADLPVPLHPVMPPQHVRGRVWVGRAPDLHEEQHLAALSRAWVIVACACVAAFAGLASATGAALVVNGSPTWHAMFMAGMALLWAGGAVWASIYAATLWRRARVLRRPELRAVPDALTFTEESP